MLNNTKNEIIKINLKRFLINLICKNIDDNLKTPFQRQFHSSHEE